MIQNTFYVLLLIMGFPVGLYLSKLCSDEIKKWRKELIGISIIALASAVAISFTSFEYILPTIMSLFFMIIVCLTIVWKSN